MATSTRSPRATPTTRRPASTSASTASRVHLYRRDAREVLAILPVGSISVLITDPPYRTVNRSGTSGHLRRWFAKSLSWSAISGVLALVQSRMRADGVALVMTNSDGLRPAIEALERAGFVRVRPIVWDKRTPGLGGGLRHQTEHVLIGHLPGSRTLAGVDLVSVPSVGPGTAGRYPTEKPADLGRELVAIARVGRGDVVVDPFCGSGALLIGAREPGATVIGCDVAAAAITRATARLTGPASAKAAHGPRSRSSAPTRGHVAASVRSRAPKPVAPTPRPARPRGAGPRRRSP
jgi:DNA modification methylase